MGILSEEDVHGHVSWLKPETNTLIHSSSDPIPTNNQDSHTKQPLEQCVVRQQLTS